MEPNQPDPNESELKKACDEIQAKKQAEAEALEQRRAEHKKKAEDAMRARSETLRKLREVGPGMSVPTHYKPHLLCKKLGKDDKESDYHGVTFRRLDGDCVLEAMNGVAAVSIVLEGEGEQCPEAGAIVPARAMRLIAAAKAEFAQVWFADAKVTVFVDDAVHEFFLIPPTLPFAVAYLRDKPTGSRMVSGAAVDGDMLHRLQKALAASHVAIRKIDKALLGLVPESDDQGMNRGFLATVGEMKS